MKGVIEKTIEFLNGEAGVTITVRPLLPFVAEGYRMRGASGIDVFGDGRRLPLEIPEDQVVAFAEAEEILLCEFPVEGPDPVRELVLQRQD
ncbi:hypothetical protein [Defluviimonas salinarum]|uniref:Uncharacterized protein n=1 Tax=Defluviimonas salinarum TaxID=2992147 RepID=A0ABT3J4I5_9RHOB|nr:hypothetical protein [Defluviimonas salinarum]MCW3782583.1 hypothetical protein [Defluviimonas salinarum]